MRPRPAEPQRQASDDSAARVAGHGTMHSKLAASCVVLLANSVRAELIYPELVGFILGDTAMPW
jgi:hypothetical protein